MSSCDLSYWSDSDYDFFFESSGKETGKFKCYECKETKDTTFEAYEAVPAQCYNFGSNTFDCEDCDGDCSEEQKQEYGASVKRHYICEDCQSLIDAFNIGCYGNLHQHIMNNITHCYKELSSEFYDKLTPNARAYIEKLIDEIDEETDDWK